MTSRWFRSFLLLVIAVSLAAIAIRPYVSPQPVFAQAGSAYAVYVEPGITTLQTPGEGGTTSGKVVIDLRNGNVWGFPTVSGLPYPSSANSALPPTSHPVLLGKFALSEMDNVPRR